MSLNINNILKYFLTIKNFYKFFFRLLREKISYYIGGFDPNFYSEYNNFLGNDICEKEFITNEIFFKTFLLLSTDEIKNFKINTSNFIDSLDISNISLKKMGGEGNLNLLNNICMVKKPKKILETGISQGFSSSIFLNYLSKINGSLTSIDLPYLHFKNSSFLIGYVVPKNIQQNWFKIIEPDYNYLKKLSLDGKKFDLIHYDSDKSIQGKLKNFELIWTILNKKGFFICDDISDDAYFHFFCKQKNLNPIIVKHENKFQGILIKN